MSKIEDKILDFVKSKNKKKNIIGLRGLVQTNEQEWSFRYTYQDGDHLSLSESRTVKVAGLEMKVSIIRKKNQKSKNKKHA